MTATSSLNPSACCSSAEASWLDSSDADVSSSERQPRFARTPRARSGSSERARLLLAVQSLDRLPQCSNLIPRHTNPHDKEHVTCDSDASVRERYLFFLLREQEELYDWSEDPGSTQNLAGNPDYEEVLSEARTGLLNWMQSSRDPLTEVFQDQIGSKKDSDSTNE